MVATHAHGLDSPVLIVVLALVVILLVILWTANKKKQHWTWEGAVDAPV